MTAPTLSRVRCVADAKAQGEECERNAVSVLTTTLTRAGVPADLAKEAATDIARQLIMATMYFTGAALAGN